MINQSIAHYKISAKIGAGGMGEVYRATDTKLGREVALKVLPEAFAADPQRMQRFQREAQLLASLNHPHIAAIYGLEHQDKIQALAMELVEGPTLAERIALGAIPLEEALPVARQMAEALEYAHEHGIIHRDLKPANIKITPDGQVKVLDFGLAKALNDDGAPADMATSPTLSMAATKAGIILGTAAYMSPEQARGKPVDRRTDIWAFGVVLFEMATGRQMFSGETVTDVMAAVVRAEPDWTLLPEDAPAHLRKLLRRCLEKDARKRLRDIGEARLALEEGPGAEAPSVAPAALPLQKQSGIARWLPWAVAALFALVAFAAVWRNGSKDAAPPIRFSIAMTGKLQLVRAENPILAIAPDGSSMVFVADSGSGPQLFVRPLNRIEALPLAGTGGASSPFFSPDSQWVGFFADGKLKKTSLSGSQPIALAEANANRGGAWAADAFIYFVPHFEGGLLRIPATGGAPEPVTQLEPGERSHRWPTILPDGQIAFVAGQASSPGNYDDAPIGIYSPHDGKTRHLKVRGGFMRYSPTGHLIIHRAGSLFGIPLQAADSGSSGVALLEGVAGESSSGAAFFDVAQNGTLVFVPAEALPSELVMYIADRKGNETLLPLRPDDYNQPRFSPDGKRLAFNIGGRGASAEVWTYDIQAHTSLRLTFGGGGSLRPVWSQDGKKLVYTRPGGQEILYEKASDGSGTEQPLHAGKIILLANDWSRDGKWLAVTEYPARGIKALSLADDKLLNIEENAFLASFSPDGRWVAYTSNAGTLGQDQVYVRSFGSAGKWQISTEGGSAPHWSRDGKELFYINGDKMMAVDIFSGPAFKSGPPHLLFTGPFLNTLPLDNFDVAPDGRFVMVRGVAVKTPGSISVVVNWKTEMEGAAQVKK